MIEMEDKYFLLEHEQKKKDFIIKTLEKRI